MRWQPALWTGQGLQTQSRSCKAYNAHVIRAALRAGQHGHGCEPGALGRWQMP